MKKELIQMANPSLSRQFTLTNFTWKLRANGHLKGEKIGAVNYLKLSRIPSDIRIYWNSTNNRDTAFSVDELVRGFKINERDEAGNAKTLDNVWLWSEGEIPLEPLSDIIEIEYNGAGDLIEPLLGNKSGAIDKIEKVQVVSAIDKVLQPIKVVQTNNTQGYKIDDFYRFNANVTQPLLSLFTLNLSDESTYYYSYGDTTYKGILLNNFSYLIVEWSSSGRTRNVSEYARLNNTNVLSSKLESYDIEITGIFFDKETKKLKDDYAFKATGTNDVSTHSFYKNVTVFEDIKNFGNGFETFRFFANQGTTFVRQNEKEYKRTFSKLIGFRNGKINGEDVSSIGKPSVVKEQNSTFSSLVERIKNNSIRRSPEAPTDSFVVCSDKIVDVVQYEENKATDLSNFLFKTKDKLTCLIPQQTKITFLSIIANSDKKADFKLRLLELLKTSTSDCALYLGGLDGIKVPIKTGFELCFNNKKTGMDYGVIEIPAGDIYKIELELLNVYEDTNND